MNFIYEGVNVYCVEGFAHVKGNKDGSGRRLVFVETLRNGICNVVQCCVGGVICFEAMLVGIVFDVLSDLWKDCFLKSFGNWG